MYSMWKFCSHVYKLAFIWWSTYVFLRRDVWKIWLGNLNSSRSTKQGSAALIYSLIDIFNKSYFHGFLYLLFFSRVLRLLVICTAIINVSLYCYNKYVQSEEKKSRAILCGWIFLTHSRNDQNFLCTSKRSDKFLIHLICYRCGSQMYYKMRSVQLVVIFSVFTISTSKNLVTQTGMCTQIIFLLLVF